MSMTEGRCDASPTNITKWEVVTVRTGRALETECVVGSNNAISYSLSVLEEVDSELRVALQRDSEVRDRGR
jgi:hypothetical protein